MTQQNPETADTANQASLHEEIVRPEWIDYNGHMNIAYYLLVFDHAADALLDRLDLGLAYRNRENCSLFVVETHILYEREVLEGDDLVINTRILSYDSKRLHLFHEMRQAGSGDIVATNEVMLLHVGMADRRTTAFRPASLERIESVYRIHQDDGMPSQVGRAIKMLQVLW